MPHLNLTSEGKIIELKNQSLGNFTFSSFKVKLLLSQRIKVSLMDQVQEWCEIRHNYILANEPKLVHSIHTEGCISIYTLFDSFISWTRRHQGFWMLQNGTAEANKYRLASCMSRAGLGRGITGGFPRVFLLISRNCCARCDLLWVTVLCNP